jgi:hypothetical protein
MPSRYRTSLRFGLNLAAAASTSSTNVVIAGNNLFDPGLSSSTAKCVGWTQLSALYNRYRVIGSKIVVKTQMSASATAGVTQISGAVAVAPSNTGLGRTLFADAIAQYKAKWVDINSAAPRNMAMVMKTSELLGQRNLEGSDRTQGLISGAPGEEWYWIITYVADAAYTNGQVVIDIQLTYDVEFFDRNEIDRSSVEGKQIHALYDEIFAIRCRQLSEHKQPHNESLPYNKAKMGLETLHVETKEEPQRSPATTEYDIEDYHYVSGRAPIIAPQRILSGLSRAPAARYAPINSQGAPPPTPSNSKS